MVKLKLAFGKLLINTHEKELNIIDHTFSVLEKTVPHQISKGSNTIVSFLDISVKEYQNRKYLVGFYGYAVGTTYKVIDSTNKTISEQKYPTPPFISDAMFVLTEDCYIMFEDKKSSYIEPEIIIEALETAFRAFAIEMPVKIKMLELSDDTKTMVDFLYSLNKLFSIEFSNLRHSNPSEKSKLFDELTDARIDHLVESSSNSEGIDRDNEEFKNQIHHVENSYGKIKKVEGTDSNGLSIMELRDNSIHLTLEIEDQEVETKLDKMIKTLAIIFEKLSLKT